MKHLVMTLLLGALVVQHPVSESPYCVHAQALQVQLAAQQQEPWTPQPGNPGHREPPDGWYCSTHATGAKKYACHRVDYDRLCEGTPTEDNAQCLVACKRDHCHCDIECRPPTKET